MPQKRLLLSSIINFNVEKWAGNLNKGGICGVLFVKLSREFDFLLHHILLAKMNANGVDYKFIDTNSEFFMQHKIQKFIDWENILICVLQGSGPFLFSIYVCECFAYG